MLFIKRATFNYPNTKIWIKGAPMPILFGHMSNLVFNVLQVHHFLMFISYLKNVSIVNDVNRWINGALTLQMWHLSCAFLAYVAPLHAIL